MATSALNRRMTGVPGRSHSIVPQSHASPSAGPARPESNRVIMNVGGVRYETYKSTLKNIPDTRLSWLTQTTAQNADFDTSTGEYFFDRHPSVFNMVLNYYRTGKLHCPTDVCGPMFEEELAFWGIDEKQIEPCCWTGYRTHRDAQETLQELDGKDDSDDSADEEDLYTAERFGIQETDIQLSWWEINRPRIWNVLEEPRSSKTAQIFAVMSVSFILVSIATFCLESHVAFRVPRNASDPVTANWTFQEKHDKSLPHQALEVLDYVCICYFTVEFFLRMVFCPKKRVFFASLLNWVDLFSFMPFYVEKLIVGVLPALETSVLVQVLKTVRLIRIFRIFKLTRHFSGLKILAHSIKASGKELLLLIMFLVISVLIFACLVYYAEGVGETQMTRNDFKNIPIGFWWAVVTMTTLGYGDMHPRSGLGYMIGAFCAVAGVLVLALPVPVIVNNFALYYSHAQARMKLPKKKKRKMLCGAHDQLQQVDDPGVAEEGESRKSSASGSQKSLDSIHKSSEDSAVGSMESDKVKAGAEGHIGETCGISVVFTDETGQETPQNSPRGAKEEAEGDDVSPNKSQPLLPNGSVPSGVVYLTVGPPHEEASAEPQDNTNHNNHSHAITAKRKDTSDVYHQRKNAVGPAPVEASTGTNMLCADWVKPNSPIGSGAGSPTGRASARRSSLRIK